MGVGEDRESWYRSAGAWIASQGEAGDLSRRCILDGPMLAMAGDVAGRRVLDIGCGEGRFARALRGRGGWIIGVDPVPALLHEARKRDPEGAYLLGSGEELPFASGSFDLAVLYLVLVDVPDFRRAIREAARVLKPGGRLIMANTHSMASSVIPSPWARDDQGRLLHMAVDEYFREVAQRIEWKGISILNFHRPLSAYMQAFLDAGLTLAEFREPVPSEEAIAAHPGLASERRAPTFVAMAWEK